MTPLKSTSSSFYDGSKVPRKEPQAIRGRTLIVTPPGSVFSAPRGKGPVGDRCRVGEHGHNMDTTWTQHEPFAAALLVTGLVLLLGSILACELAMLRL